MNDTTRRFLTAIVDRVPNGGRIVELRLFPAIRQGGIESGVAVVAVEPPEPVVEVVEGAEVAPGGVTGDATAAGDSGVATVDTVALDAPDAPALVDDQHFAEAVTDLIDTDVAVEDEEGQSGDDVAAHASFVPMADAADESETADALDDEVHTIVLNVERDVVAAEAYADDEADALVVAADTAEERTAEVTLHVEPEVADEESPYADAPAPGGTEARPILADAPEARDALGEAIGDARARLASPVGGIEVIAEPADVTSPNDEESIALGDILALPSPGGEGEPSEGGADPAVADVTEVAPRLRRYAILTARYRLTIKGPDRGKWDVEITHEADAPLDTVERVARGVAKRAGEESDPEHFSAESLQAALAAPVWATTP